MWVSILERESRRTLSGGQVTEDAVLCRGMGDPAWGAGNPQFFHPQSASRMQSQQYKSRWVREKGESRGGKRTFRSPWLIYFALYVQIID